MGNLTKLSPTISRHNLLQLLNMVKLPKHGHNPQLGLMYKSFTPTSMT
jgi:hypothetical protein